MGKVHLLEPRFFPCTQPSSNPALCVHNFVIVLVYEEIIGINAGSSLLTRRDGSQSSGANANSGA